MSQLWFEILKDDSTFRPEPAVSGQEGVAV